MAGTPPSTEGNDHAPPLTQVFAARAGRGGAMNNDRAGKVAVILNGVLPLFELLYGLWLKNQNTTRSGQYRLEQ